MQIHPKKKKVFRENALFQHIFTVDEFSKKVHVGFDIKNSKWFSEG
jgi:hypothetical protein